MTNEWDLSMFDIDDLYVVAVAIERSGYDFYSELIEPSSSSQVKGELLFLRNEEGNHEAYFRGQLAKRGKTPAESTNEKLMDFVEKEFLAPVQRLFRAKEVYNQVKALYFGIELEQKTIDFYSSMKEGHSNADEKADLDAIMKEEEGHKRKLMLIVAH